MKETTTVEALSGPSASLQYKTQSMLKEEEKLKNLDPRKAEQMQRLGMGMTGVRGYVDDFIPGDIFLRYRYSF